MTRTAILLLALLALATPAWGQGLVPAASYTMEAQRASDVPLEVGAVEALKVHITRSCPPASIEQPETTILFMVHADDPALRVLGALEAVMPSQMCVGGGQTVIEHQFELALAHAPNGTLGSVALHAQPERGGAFAQRPDEVVTVVAVPMADAPVDNEPVLQQTSQESPGAAPTLLAASLAALGVAMRRR